MYVRVLGLDVCEVVPRLLHQSGCSSRSSIVMACTLAPAMTPLWAIGVAIAMALAQLWPGRRDVRRIAQRDGRHVPRDVADVVGAAAAACSSSGSPAGRGARRIFDAPGRAPAPSVPSAAPWRASGRPRSMRQAHLLDVRVHRFGHRLVEVPRPGRAQDARGERGVGHQRGALRHLVADAPQILDVRRSRSRGSSTRRWRCAARRWAGRRRW